MRWLIEWAIAATMACVAIGLVQRWAAWLACWPIDYFLIIACFGLFIFGIFAFDRHAEEKGWIVHHWWE